MPIASRISSRIALPKACPAPPSGSAVHGPACARGVARPDATVHLHEIASKGCARSSPRAVLGKLDGWCAQKFTQMPSAAIFFAVPGGQRHAQFRRCSDPEAALFTSVSRLSATGRLTGDGIAPLSGSARHGSFRAAALKAERDSWGDQPPHSPAEGLDRSAALPAA